MVKIGPPVSTICAQGSVMKKYNLKKNVGKSIRFSKMAQLKKHDKRPFEQIFVFLEKYWTYI